LKPTARGLAGGKKDATGRRDPLKERDKYLTKTAELVNFERFVRSKSGRPGGNPGNSGKEASSKKQHR